MNLNKTILASVFALTTSFGALAEDYNHTIYLGGGVNTESAASNSTPVSIGYIYNPESSNFYHGVDVSAEGLLYDSTSRRDNVEEQGTSVNYLTGYNFNFSNGVTVSTGVLMGIRITEEECPDSYLGYRCWADREPQRESEFNYGGTVHVKYKHLFVGARISGVSNQILVGYTF